MDEATEIPSRRRIDGITALMLVVTAASLVGAAWLGMRRPPENEPPSVGDLAPPLRLLDLESSEPLVLVGLRGKVVWVVFWSADSSSSRSSLIEIERASGQLKARRRFAMVAAAVEADNPDRVKAAVTTSGVKLPVYLASPEARRSYGTLRADPPLHVLIDADGRIASIARGAGIQTIERIAEQARRLLDALGPGGETRFAVAHAAGRGAHNDGRGAPEGRSPVRIEQAPSSGRDDFRVGGGQLFE
jgi:peroxiredoxin